MFQWTEFSDKLIQASIGECIIEKPLGVLPAWIAKDEATLYYTLSLRFISLSI